MRYTIGSMDNMKTLKIWSLVPAALLVWVAGACGDAASLTNGGAKGADDTDGGFIACDPADYQGECDEGGGFCGAEGFCVFEEGSLFEGGEGGECDTTADCSAGETCEDGTCVSGEGAEGGGGGEGIEGTSGEGSEGSGAGEGDGGTGGDGGIDGCKSDAECKEGETCDTTTGLCRVSEENIGQIQVNPTLLDFGSVAFGMTSEPKEFTITNTGKVDVKILSVKLDAQSSKTFAIESASLGAKDLKPDDLANFVLTPSSQVTVRVTNTPDDAVPDTGAVVIVNDSATPTVTVDLVNQFKGDPDFTLLDDKKAVAWPDGSDFYTHEFGEAAQGKTATAAFQIRNDGNGNNPLTISDISFDSSSANKDQFEFKVTRPGSGTELAVPVRLNPGEVVDFTLTYKPTKKGIHTASLNLVTNDKDAKHPLADTAPGGTGDVRIDLKGQSGVVPPLFKIAKTMLDFGEVSVGDEHEEMVTIANDSPDFELTIEHKWLLSNTEFTYDPPPKVLKPSESFTLRVRYKPGQVGASGNKLEFTTSDPVNPVQTIEVKGAGVAPGLVVVPASPIQMGSVPFGTSSQPQKVVLKNSGSGTLEITGISQTAGAPEFTVKGLPTAYPVKLTGLGAQVEFEIVFTPTDKFPYSGEIQVLHPGLPPGQTVITVEGTGSDCAPGFVDLNGDGSDGCEYECTFQSADDPPDTGSTFTDANCDGVDGDAVNDVFVSPAGNDTAPGTKDEPVQTLPKAIAIASNKLPRARVLVAVGSYQLDNTLPLFSGVSLYGGYDASKGWKRTTAAKSTLNGPVEAVKAENLAAATVVNRLTIKSAANTDAGGWSVGLIVKNSGDFLTIEDVEIVAGKGGPGEAGTPGGTKAASGLPGAPGGNGCENSGMVFGSDAGIGCGNCGRPGGGLGGTSTCAAPGGDGGQPGRYNKESSTNGTKGGGPKGGSAGTGGATKNKGAGPGTPGGKGGDGDLGEDGKPGNGFGELDADGTWSPSVGLDGKDGTSGSGGGGGGGGGGGCGDDTLNTCCYDYGGGGGGGGAGGCGGKAGKAGKGGGASFGVYVISSTPNINNSIITTSAGGKGGAAGQGADGGDGGDGGTSGLNNDASGVGGAGGTGGKGGRGGHGGGGGGGPSICIVTVGTLASVVESGNTFNPGAGGAGGDSPGSNDGATGESTDIKFVQ